MDKLEELLALLNKEQIDDKVVIDSRMYMLITQATIELSRIKDVLNSILSISSGLKK